MSHKDRSLLLSLCHVETKIMDILMTYLCFLLVPQSRDCLEPRSGYIMFPETLKKKKKNLSTKHSGRTKLAINGDACTVLQQQLQRSFPKYSLHSFF